MIPQKIVTHEADFESNHKDSSGKKFVISPGLPPKSQFLSPLDNTAGYYINDYSKKDLVVLHYTCGFLKGDIATLTEHNSQLSVHFVIGRNGKIYQLIPTEFWAYHLGRSCIGGNTFNSMRSISIELSNIGPLSIRKLADESLYDIYGNAYCLRSEYQYYTSVLPLLNGVFRGYTYYASFTDEQYSSLNSLLDWLCENLGIQKNYIEYSNRFDTFKEPIVKSFTGICSHANFRVDKTDIGPSFDWKRING